MKEEEFLKEIGPKYALTNRAMEIVKADLEYGLLPEEIEKYLTEPGEKAMEFYSQCIHAGMPEDTIKILTENGLNIMQKKVLFEYWEKGVSDSVLEKVAMDKEKAHVMNKKLNGVLTTQFGESEIRDMLETILEKLEMQSSEQGKGETKVQELSEIKQVVETPPEEDPEFVVPTPKEIVQERNTFQPVTEPEIEWQHIPDNSKRLVTKIFENRIKKSSKKQLFQLLIKKKLEADQICEIKNGYAKGLTEEQLCDMIQAHLSATKMAEIVDLAVLVNRQKEE